MTENMKKLIKNAKIVTPKKIFDGSIVVGRLGKIENIISGSIDSFDGEMIDVKGNYVLPGMVEVHGHLREPAESPGFSEKGDVPHETRAALAGGVTTVFDMPNSSPPTTTVKRLREKIEKIYPGRSFADYAFWMGASRDHIDELEKVDPKEIVGDKVFMAGHETSPATIPDDETLKKIFEILTRRGILVAVHAEDQELVNSLTKKFKDLGKTDASIWSQARPKEVTTQAVRRAISLAKQQGNRLYLLHLASPEEFDLVDEAKKSGQDVYGELLGHSLIFTIDDYARLGNRIKVAPALGTKEDQNEMWRRFREGKIDTICAEHAPHAWADKLLENVWDAPAGLSGLQEVLPGLMTTFVNRFGNENIEEFLKLISRYWSKKVAEIFNLTSKGAIEVGKDADLVVIDTTTSWIVKKEDLFAKGGGSAYEGMKLIGRPTMTFLRGELVYQNGKIVGEPQGRWIKEL